MGWKKQFGGGRGGAGGYGGGYGGKSWVRQHQPPAQSPRPTAYTPPVPTTSASTAATAATATAAAAAAAAAMAIPGGCQVCAEHLRNAEEQLLFIEQLHTELVTVRGEVTALKQAAKAAQTDRDKIAAEAAEAKHLAKKRLQGTQAELLKTQNELSVCKDSLAEAKRALRAAEQLEKASNLQEITDLRTSMSQSQMEAMLFNKKVTLETELAAVKLQLAKQTEARQRNDRAVEQLQEQLARQKQTINDLNHLLGNRMSGGASSAKPAIPEIEEIELDDIEPIQARVAARQQKATLPLPSVLAAVAPASAAYTIRTISQASKESFSDPLDSDDDDDGKPVRLYQPTSLAQKRLKLSEINPFRK